MKLRSVRESDLRRLLGHGAADFGDSVTDTDNGGLAGSVEESAAAPVDDPATLPTNGNGIVFLEIAGEKPAARRHEPPGGGLCPTRMYVLRPAPTPPPPPTIHPP